MLDGAHGIRARTCWLCPKAQGSREVVGELPARHCTTQVSRLAGAAICSNTEHCWHAPQLGCHAVSSMHGKLVGRLVSKCHHTNIDRGSAGNLREPASRSRSAPARRERFDPTQYVCQQLDRYRQPRMARSPVPSRAPSRSPSPSVRTSSAGTHVSEIIRKSRRRLHVSLHLGGQVTLMFMAMHMLMPHAATALYQSVCLLQHMTAFQPLVGQRCPSSTATPAPGRLAASDRAITPPTALSARRQHGPCLLQATSHWEVQARRARCWTACAGPQPRSGRAPAARTLARPAQTPGKAACPHSHGPGTLTALRPPCTTAACEAPAQPKPGPPGRAAPLQRPTLHTLGSGGAAAAPQAPALPPRMLLPVLQAKVRACAAFAAVLCWLVGWPGASQHAGRRGPALRLSHAHHRVPERWTSLTPPGLQLLRRTGAPHLPWGQVFHCRPSTASRPPTHRRLIPWQPHHPMAGQR